MKFSVLVMLLLVSLLLALVVTFARVMPALFGLVLLVILVWGLLKR